MGKVWYSGGVAYQDCDHCGLSFNLNGQLRREHEAGTCVKVFSTSKQREHTQKEEAKKTYGADTQATSWPPRRLPVRVVGSDADKAGGGVVVTPTPSRRRNPVEKGWS